MQNLKTELTELWYIFSVENHGSITKTSKGVYYSDNRQSPETFQTLEDYEARCIELNITLDE